MSEVKNRHKNQSEYDLYGDVEKIKAALLDTTNDVKGKAGELLSDSVKNIKEQSSALSDNVSNYTAKKPFKSLGIALLAGIAIGYFLRK